MGASRRASGVVSKKPECYRIHPALASEESSIVTSPAYEGILGFLQAQSQSRSRFPLLEMSSVPAEQRRFFISARPSMQERRGENREEGERVSVAL